MAFLGFLANYFIETFSLVTPFMYRVVAYAIASATCSPSLSADDKKSGGSMILHTDCQQLPYFLRSFIVVNIALSLALSAFVLFGVRSIRTNPPRFLLQVFIKPLDHERIGALSYIASRIVRIKPSYRVNHWERIPQLKASK